jgi:hypothetical protein
MKALGITAMILAIVFIFLPGGRYATVIASLLAAFTVGPGSTYSAVAIILGFINTILLSPSVWIMDWADRGDAKMFGEEVGFFGQGMIIVSVHIVCAIIFYFMNKKKKEQAINYVSD